jgi:hypothetical protein
MYRSFRLLKPIASTSSAPRIAGQALRPTSLAIRQTTNPTPALPTLVKGLSLGARRGFAEKSDKDKIVADNSNVGRKGDGASPEKPKSQHMVDHQNATSSAREEVSFQAFFVSAGVLRKIVSLFTICMEKRAGTR